MSVICFYTSCLSTSLFNYKTKQQVIINARTHPVQIDDKELQNLHVTRETAKKLLCYCFRVYFMCRLFGTFCYIISGGVSRKMDLTARSETSAHKIQRTGGNRPKRRSTAFRIWRKFENKNEKKNFK